jgi:hypothetical protein
MPGWPQSLAECLPNRVFAHQKASSVHASCMRGACKAGQPMSAATSRCNAAGGRQPLLTNVAYHTVQRYSGMRALCATCVMKQTQVLAVMTPAAVIVLAALLLLLPAAPAQR